MAYNPYILYTSKTACKIRVACSGLIYQKLLRIKKSSIEDGQNGQIINLLSSDLTKFDVVLMLVADTVNGPVQMVVFFILIYLEIGFNAVIGMAFLASFIPLQSEHLDYER